MFFDASGDANNDPYPDLSFRKLTDQEMCLLKASFTYANLWLSYFPRQILDLVAEMVSFLNFLMRLRDLEKNPTSTRNGFC